MGSPMILFSHLAMNHLGRTDYILLKFGCLLREKILEILGCGWGGRRKGLERDLGNDERLMDHGRGEKGEGGERYPIACP